ncbi:MAG: helicase [Candidatus Eisenbacteria bacterium]
MRYQVVELGRTSKAELRAKLDSHSVCFNEYAERLFDSDLFTVTPRPAAIRCVELEVRELGLEEGGTTEEILAKARAHGFETCPIELGPRLRLLRLDQAPDPDGTLASQGRAPDGSITILSEPLVDDDAFPKGFYLRRLGETLWLRGYRSDAEHRWSASDRIVLAVRT